MFRFFKLIFFVVLAFIAGKMMAEDTGFIANQESQEVESPYAQMAHLLADPEFKEQNPVEYRRLAALALMLRARALATIAQSEELES
jgi:hypothetical protein